MLSATIGKRADAARRGDRRFQWVPSQIADDEAGDDGIRAKRVVGEAPHGRRLEDQFVEMDTITDRAHADCQQLQHQQAAPADGELAV